MTAIGRKSFKITEHSYNVVFRIFTSALSIKLPYANLVDFRRYLVHRTGKNFFQPFSSHIT